MKLQYIDNLKESVKYRDNQTPSPNLNLVLLSVILFNFSYIALSIMFPPQGKPLKFHFANELGSITALSAIYLSMASAFSIGTLLISIRTKSTDILLWTLLALVFALLSLDELMQFHERFGSFIRGYVSSGIFRGWNDVIVILYGVIALPFAAIFFKKIIRYRGVAEFFIIAFVFYGVHTLIDSTQQPQTTVSVIFEESFKLFCGSMLTLGAFTGFLGSLWNYEENTKLSMD